MKRNEIQERIIGYRKLFRSTRVKMDSLMDIIHDDQTELNKKIKKLQQEFESKHSDTLNELEIASGKLQEYNTNLRDAIVHLYRKNLDIGMKQKKLGTGFSVSVKEIFSVYFTEEFPDHDTVLTHVKERFPICVTYDTDKLEKQAKVFDEDELKKEMPYIFRTPKPAARIMQEFWDAENLEFCEPETEVENEA